MLVNSLSMRLLCAVIAAVLVLCIESAQRSGVPPLPQAVWPVEQPAASGWRVDALTLTGSGHIPMPADTPAAHASSLLAMSAGQPVALTVFWFSGERESGPNVQIAASQWSRATQQWAPARFVVNRHTLGAQLDFGVRRLGNPVAWMDGVGRIHLFVVATGAGGWAASRIVQLRQSSVGNGLAELAFEPVRVLPLSWAWNTSHLVRNAPQPLADGGMVLPVHFELGIKYPMALRFDREGEFLGVTRISRKKYALQPTFLAQTASDWTALMRDERPDGRVIAARTTDGGRSWVDLPDLALLNPDSSVGGMAFGPGHMVLAHNTSAGTRAQLDLSGSVDGVTWTAIRPLARGADADEFSYPAMAWVDGSLWVSYTVDRHHIDWQRFTPTPVSAARGKP